ncbi:MAG: FlgD immunoglobulin-like domain containing protein [Alphaproteobacteria bacterium]|nr:FlgD immunoglobulin-like domain containing protein [Alphaproteobacteria bacterium]
MSVSAISSLSSLSSSAASATAASSAAQSSALNLNFSTYLKILTTQLQNQDPTNATDPNQFTQELIQMQQVQAQITNNEAIDSLINAIGANNLASGVSYIGNYVRAATEDGDFSLQGSSAEIGYTLAKDVSNATITIKDSDGDTVATLTGGTSMGDNYVSWDGTTEDGEIAEDGAYTFTVTAKDSSGSDVTVSNKSALFKVTAVQSNSDGTLTLEAGALSLLSTDVTGVYSAASLPTAVLGTRVTES